MPVWSEDGGEGRERERGGSWDWRERSGWTCARMCGHRTTCRCVFTCVYTCRCACVCTCVNIGMRGQCIPHRASGANVRRQAFILGKMEVGGGNSCDIQHDILFLNPSKICITKCTTLTISKHTIQWHSAHSFTMLCNHHYYIFPEPSQTETVCPLNTNSHSPAPQALESRFYFLSLRVIALDTSQVGSHSICPCMSGSLHGA